jgi:hypothetical protein
VMMQRWADYLSALREAKVSHVVAEIAAS